MPLLPLLRRPFQTRLWVLPAAGLSAAVLCFAVGATRTGPRLSTLAYLEDAATGKAQWVSFHMPDAWTRSLMTEPAEDIRFGGGAPTPARPQSSICPDPRCSRTGSA